MEFGALIPLWYMSMCCMFSTPLVGIGLLIFIRFSRKDVRLAKYILATVVLVCLLWFIFPFGQLIYSYIRICQVCPESTFKLTRELLISTLGYAARLALIPGSASGFIVAYLVVLPTTLIVRKRRKAKREGQSSG